MAQGVDGNEAPVQQFVDFSRHGFEEVKRYLVEYGQGRTRDGFAIIQDSLSAFYDCLCVPLSGGDRISTGIFNIDANLAGLNVDYPNATWTNQDGDRTGTSGGDGDASSNPIITFHPMEQSGSDQLLQSLMEATPSRLPRSNIAIQRQRTGKLKLNDLNDYFHLPIQVASKRLGLCSTALKKICRRNGLKRWPYRKIKSIDRNIQSLQRSLIGTSEPEYGRIQAEILKLQHQRAQVCAGITSESSDS